jgi:hypothetical protein
VPLLNHAKIRGPEIAEVLEPGERLLALGLYRDSLNGDRSRLELADSELTAIEQRFQRETGQRLAGSDSVVQGVDWQGVHVNSGRVNRLLFGLDGVGAVKSAAGQMWRAAHDRSSGLRYWAVTDRRLLLLRDRTGTDQPWQIGYAVTRSTVRSVRRRGKLLLQWGRVEVVFADDSMLAWLTGFVDVGAARQLVRAMATTL